MITKEMAANYKHALRVAERIAPATGTNYRTVGHLPSHGVCPVATDGSSRQERSGQRWGGWAWYADPDTFGFGEAQDADPCVAELCAAVAALRALPAWLPVEVVTDHEHIAALLTGPAGGRAPQLVGPSGERAIRRASGRRRELLCQLRDLVAARPGPVSSRKVKSHRGAETDPLNVAADQLARRVSRLARARDCAVTAQSVLPPAAGAVV